MEVEVIMCQADDVQTGDSVSPSALQSSDCADAERRIEREIMAAIEVLHEQALAAYRRYVASTPRKMNKEQAIQHAYLHGKVAGLGAARREFELRQPIKWQDGN
jgi:hypothetical protein